MKEKYSRRGAFQRALGCWGEFLTADHFFATNDGCVGRGGLRCGFVIRDVWSRFLQNFPVPNKTTEEVEFSLRQFAAARLREVATLYSDQAIDIRRACRRLHILYEDSRAGVHHTNAIAERGNQLVERGTTSCLIEAGLPTAYWPIAVKFSVTTTMFRTSARGPRGAKRSGKSSRARRSHSAQPFSSSRRQQDECAGNPGPRGSWVYSLGINSSRADGGRRGIWSGHSEC